MLLATSSHADTNKQSQTRMLTQVVGLDFASDMLVDATARQRAMEAEKPPSKQCTPMQ
jgi:hypothetical protein